MLNKNLNATGKKPCACCGMGVINPHAAPKQPRAFLGLKVYGGHLGKAHVGDTQEIAHVNTKNGPITVVSRHAW